MRSIIDRLILRHLRRDEFNSERLRSFYENKYGVSVGLYSYGCFDPARFRRGVRIGRYCSFAPTSAVFTRNHPLENLTTHPLLYEARFDFGEIQKLPFGECEFEDDVWVGHNSTFLPGVKRVGRGSVIGAGSVVTRDVPRYCVMAGNPARVIKSRFDEPVIKLIEESRWWEFSISELSDISKKHRGIFVSTSESALLTWLGRAREVATC